jgi:hypothetical protein
VTAGTEQVSGTEISIPDTCSVPAVTLLKAPLPPRSWYRIQQAALIVIVIVIGAVENTNFVSTTLPGPRSQEYPP